MPADPVLPASSEGPGAEPWPDEPSGGPAAPPADLQLVERLRAGEEAAFVQLVEALHAPLVRLAATFVRDHASAEEVVQDAWLGVLRGLARFEGRSSLRTWIYRIVANRARTRAVRERRVVPFSAAFPEGEDREPAVDPDRFDPTGHWTVPPQPWADPPEVIAQRRQAVALVERAIAELPVNQRLVVTLRDVEGLESSEVCHILGISETNQRVLLHRGRAKIRRELEASLEGLS